MGNQNLIPFVGNRYFGIQIEAKVNHIHQGRRLLIIEPYGAINSLIQYALDSQYSIIILTANQDLRCVPHHLLKKVDLAIQVDTADQNEVEECIKILHPRCSIHAVIPGFEYFVPLAARISHQLGLPGIHPKDVIKSRAKNLMRLSLSKAGLPLPQFAIVQSFQELSLAIQKIGFPAICKPIDAAGSVNVKKVDSIDQAYVAADRILNGNDKLWGHKISQSLLFEEFVEGKEYSVEGIVQNRQIIYFSITEKFLADQLEFIEIGHISNVPVDMTLKNRIEMYLNKVIQVLNMNHCPFHAEFRINSQGQPILMEIAARLAGDCIGNLINLARNVNYFEAVISIYLGIPISLPKMDNAYAGIRFFYRPEVEFYTKVEGLDKINQQAVQDFCLYYKDHECIPSFPKALRRLGHIIIKHENYHLLTQLLEEADKSMVFVSI